MKKVFCIPASCYSPPQPRPNRSRPCRSRPPASIKNPVSSAFSDILPAARKTPSPPSNPCPPTNSASSPLLSRIVRSPGCPHGRNELRPVQQCRGRPRSQGRRSERHGLERQARRRAQNFVDFCANALTKMDDSKLGEMGSAMGGQQLRAPDSPWESPAIGPTITPRPQCICASTA